MLMRLLCRKTTQKETPNSPMNGGRPLKNILFFIDFIEENLLISSRKCL